MFPLPFSSLTVTFDESQRRWAGDRSLTDFIPAADLQGNVLHRARGERAYRRGYQTKKFLTRVAAAEKLHTYFCFYELDCRDEGVWRVTSTGGFDYGSKAPK